MRSNVKGSFIDRTAGDVMAKNKELLKARIALAKTQTVEGVGQNSTRKVTIIGDGSGCIDPNQSTAVDLNSGEPLFDEQTWAVMVTAINEYMTKCNKILDPKGEMKV